MNIAIIGSNGRMGGALCLKLEEKHELIKIDKTVPIEEAKDAEIVIDFSSGENSAKTAMWCEKYNKKLIVGATGQNKGDLKKISKSSEKIPIVMAGNFSLGVARIKRALSELVKEDVDSIAIVEKHHKNKKDSPSGTAKELKEYIIDNFKKEVQVCSVRGGNEIGIHEIDVYYDNEVIRISHQAFSRDAFVRGVELSIEFLKRQNGPGLYEFRL